MLGGCITARSSVLDAIMLFWVAIVFLAGCSSGEVTTTDFGDETSSTTRQADMTLFPVMVAGKWGYIDRQGDVVVDRSLMTPGLSGKG